MEELTTGAILELDERSLKGVTDERQDYFSSAELLESLRLDSMDGGSDEDDAGDDNALPFEKLARKMQPLTEDGGVLKRVLRPGAGPAIPEDTCVAFHYNAYLEMGDEPFDSTRLRNQPQRSLLDDVSVVGLSLALRTMKKGEVAQVMVAPQYAFGVMGCPPRIPKNATILYDVELLHFVDARDALDQEEYPVEGATRAPFEKVYELCCAKHSAGNEFFESNEVAKALKCFCTAIRVLEKSSTSGEGQEKQQQALLLKLYNNASLSCLQMGKANMAVHYAKQALQIEGENAKALYRCGRGLMMLGCLDNAKQYLRRAQRREPSSAVITRMLCILDDRKRQERHAEDVMYRRMFGTIDASRTTASSVSDQLDAGVKASIRENLVTFQKELGKEGAVRELPFTTGFTDPYLAYVRSVCTELGLGCEDLPTGGVKAVAPKE